MTTAQTVLRLTLTLVVMTFFVSACSQDKAPAQLKVFAVSDSWTNQGV